MESFSKFIEEDASGKPVKISGGGKSVTLKPGQNVSFTHAQTGKKVTGTFRKRAVMGGRHYAHVSMPDGTGMYVPPHHLNEAKEMTSTNVEKALKHDCASHVIHGEYGEGFCIPEMHTIVEVSEGVGFVTHYDVMFEDCMICNVPVEELEIIEAMSHGHAPKKKKKPVDESMYTPSRYDIMRKQRERASADTPKKPAEKDAPTGSGYSITRMKDKDGKAFTQTTHKDKGKETSSKKVYDEEVVNEKMTNDAKKNIQRALGSKHPTNNLRKTSSAAKAMINIAKSNPKNMK